MGKTKQNKTLYSAKNSSPRYGIGKNPNSHPTGWHHSETTKKKMREANKGEKSGLWKGEKVGYSAIHCWLKVNFGKADRCHSPVMSSSRPCSKKYEWALKKGRKYARRRENFFMSCTSCHKIYDQIINNIKKQ